MESHRTSSRKDWWDGRYKREVRDEKERIEILFCLFELQKEKKVKRELWKRSCIRFSRIEERCDSVDWRITLSFEQDKDKSKPRQVV